MESERFPISISRRFRHRRPNQPKSNFTRPHRNPKSWSGQVYDADGNELAVKQRGQFQLVDVPINSLTHVLPGARRSPMRKLRDSVHSIGSSTNCSSVQQRPRSAAANAHRREWRISPTCVDCRHRYVQRHSPAARRLAMTTGPICRRRKPDGRDRHCRHRPDRGRPGRGRGQSGSAHVQLQRHQPHVRLASDARRDLVHRRQPVSQWSEL